MPKFVDHHATMPMPPEMAEAVIANWAMVTIYVEVEDLQAYLDKAVSLGGTVVMPVTVIPNMVTMAQFADPQGNVVGMVKSEQH